MDRTKRLAPALSPSVRFLVVLSIGVLFAVVAGLDRAGASARKQAGSARRARKRPKDDRSFTPSASTGTTGLYTLQGSGAPTANADYVSSTGGLNTPYHYFIEVPSGLGQLQVDIFDADVGAGGAAEAAAGRDRHRGGFDTAAVYTLIDPSGSTRTTNFTTGNATGPTGADNAWLNLFTSGTGNTVRDNFTTAAYTSNDGNNNWSGNWTETGDDNSATTGRIQITGGELRIGNPGGAASIQRSADLLGVPGLNFTRAFLRFSYRTSNNLEDADQLQVAVSSGGAFTTLETFSNDSSGSRTYDITSFIANTTTIRFSISGGYTGNGEFFFADNVEIVDAGAATAGHWELRVDMSSAATGGDDINAIGIRAHDGTSGAGGTELNVYYDSQNGFGVNPPASGTQSRSYQVYPYVTSGCSCSKNDFDYDSNSGNVGSINFTSRSGAFTQNFASGTLSANDAWDRRTIAGYTSDSAASDYGIWNTALSITSYLVGGTPNGNYIVFYVGNFQAAANPPTANPTTNAFRVYLPTDTGAAPVKPYLSQTAAYFSGPSPPAINQTTVVTVTVLFVNPTNSALTFSASRQITANVPGSGATYNGNATVTQGTITSQPAVNGTGNITWNPGNVSANTAARLTYRVNAMPTGAGQRVALTAPPASGNGTRATFVDETGNITQSRATFTFGPLCDLAVTEGASVPTAVQDLTCTAAAFPDGVSLEWSTSYEVDNLGFNIYREVQGERTLVNDGMVAGSAVTAGAGTALTAGMHYKWWDKLDGDKQGVCYWIEDVDLTGDVRIHGPFMPDEGGERPTGGQSVLLSAVGADYASPTGSEYQPQHQYAGVTVKHAASKSFPTAAAKAIDLAGQHAAKLMVTEEGWYRVPISDLIAAGLNPSFNPAYLQLYAEGEEQPLRLAGVIDGSFGNGSTGNEAIEFYATGQDTPYTNARTYWVVVGNEPGPRIGTTNAPAGTFPGSSFPFTVELKERMTYFAALKNGDAENFFGRIVTPTPVQQQLTLKSIDSTFSGDARVEVSMQGLTELPGTADHQVLVKVNNDEAGRIVFDGRAKVARSFNVPQALLSNGTNTVTLASLGGASDVSLVDYIRITYRHAFIADADSLKFTIEQDFEPGSFGSTRAGVAVGGFSSPLIRVLDVTDPNAPKEIVGEVQQTGGGFAVSIETADPLPRTMIAMADGAFKRPASVVPNQPSNLRDPRNHGDMIIIAHSKVIGSVAPLKALRQKQGIGVVVANVEDIYDEFNFGEKSPKAIRDFLSMSMTKPGRQLRFVLLVGDASIDPKNYLGLGDLDLVPTKMVASSALETASDDWFADFNQDGIADVAIGRLPVLTSIEANALASKIIEYDRAGGNSAKRGAVLVADRNDGFNFEGTSNQLSELLPPGMPVQRIYRGKMDDATARTALIQAINNNSMLVNYAGHGSSTIWRGNLLDLNSAQQLKSSDPPAMFISMTCLNGLFVDPFSKCLGEALLESTQGGAIAVWGSSALTDPSQQSLVDQELFRQLFPGKGPAPTIGEAVLRAKLAASDSDVRQTWILLGDPSLKLR